MDHEQLAEEESDRVKALAKAEAANTFKGLPQPEDYEMKQFLAKQGIIQAQDGDVGGLLSIPEELGVNFGGSRNDLGLSSKSADPSTDSEYERLMRDILQPPASLRKNVPLNNFQSKMPKVFKQDELYDIKLLDQPEAKSVITLLEVSPDVDQNVYVSVPKAVTPKNMKSERIRSPDRGGIRLCRVVEDARVTGTGFPAM